MEDKVLFFKIPKRLSDLIKEADPQLSGKSLREINELIAKEDAKGMVFCYLGEQDGDQFVWRLYSVDVEKLIKIGETICIAPEIIFTRDF